MELSKEEKEQLKKNRIKEYLVRIYVQEMDMAACEAVGDAEGMERAKTNIERLKKAIEAVEGL